MKIVVRLFCLCALLVLQPAFAQTLAGSSTNLRFAQATKILDYSLEEYTYPYRNGPAVVFQYSATSNPWRGGKLLQEPKWPAMPNSLEVLTRPKCSSSSSWYGLYMNGWLFGPAFGGDSNQALIEIRKIIPEAPAGTQMYTSLAGTSLPDGSTAAYVLCDGTMIKEKLYAMFAFIYPTSKRMPSGSYQIGDHLVVDMVTGGGNIARILSPSPLGPVVKSSASVQPPEVNTVDIEMLGEQWNLPPHMMELLKQTRSQQ